MVNAAAPLSLTTPLLPAPAASGAPRGFSFDAAVAAVRRNAARALKAHGGAPTDVVTRASGEAPGADAPAAEPAPARAGEGGAGAARAGAAPEAPGAARAPKSAMPSPPLAAAGALPAAGAPLTAAPAPAAPASLSASAPAALRDASARIRAEAPRAPLPSRAPSLAAAQFAEILARRLEDATQFDLRLDPPALGSVDGRLTLTDDGQATLALSFDNPSAFDYFRQDAGALRLALGDAGFDLAGRNLQFSFREPSRAERGGPAREVSFSDPAPLHRGAVDIRA